MFSFIKKLLTIKLHFFKKPNKIDFNTKADTIPEAFGFPEKQYKLLVNQLTNFITGSDRLGSLDSYLNSEIFKKFDLDLNNPQHAAILGYAFCAAVTMQRELEKQQIINNVLKVFNAPSDGIKKNPKHLSN
jgi:hypothetical protein